VCIGCKRHLNIGYNLANTSDFADQQNVAALQLGKGLCQLSSLLEATFLSCGATNPPGLIADRTPPSTIYIVIGRKGLKSARPPEVRSAERI
jgi:hypothetical protein